MFDRDGLRTQLDYLWRQGYRTLNITGLPGTGKTYSLQLVQLLCASEDFPVLHVDVEDWGTSEFDAIGLIEACGIQLRVDFDTTSVDNVPDPHTRARLLLYEFRETFPSDAGRPLWFVIDGLDRPNVQPDATAFVERLLKSIDVDGRPANVRFVVTGFKGIAPRDSRKDQTRAIAERDVRDLIDIVVGAAGAAVPDDVIEAWVADSMAAYEAPEGDLPELGDTLFRKMREYFDGDDP